MVFNRHDKKRLDTKLSFRIKRSSPLPKRSGDTVRSSSIGFGIRSPHQHACEVPMRSSSIGFTPHQHVCEVPTRSLSTGCIRSPHQRAGDDPARSSLTEHNVRSPQQHAREVAIPAAEAAISTVQGVPQSQLAGSIVNYTTAVFNNTACAFQPLLSRIDTFVRIGRVFSEVHACLNCLPADPLTVHVTGTSLHQVSIHGPDCRLRGLYSSHRAFICKLIECVGYTAATRSR